MSVLGPRADTSQWQPGDLVYSDNVDYVGLLISLEGNQFLVLWSDEPCLSRHELGSWDDTWRCERESP